jgi:hypothetical protein
MRTLAIALTILGAAALVAADSLPDHAVILFGIAITALIGALAAGVVFFRRQRSTQP